MELKPSNRLSAFGATRSFVKWNRLPYPDPENHPEDGIAMTLTKVRLKFASIMSARAAIEHVTLKTNGLAPTPLARPLRCPSAS